LLRLSLCTGQKLREQLKQKELKAALAANAAVCERGLLLAPIAAATLARIQARRVQMLEDRVLLATLIGDAGAPQFPADASVFFRAREAAAERRRPFSDVTAEAACDAIDLAVGPRGHSAEEVNLVMGATHQWAAQLAALLVDADAPLPSGEA
jgi:hypothetical protein